MTKFAALALVTLAALPTPPATAKATAWQVGADSIRLYNPDLAMNSAADRAQLLARVERAADRLCRDAASPRDCTRATVAATMTLPGSAALRLAAAERGGLRLAAR